MLFRSKRIDLVFRERMNRCCVTAVELKLRQWRRALWQAVHNRQVATYSYIALPESTVPSVDREMLRALGLGLIVTDGKGARVVINAKRSPHLNEALAEKVASFMESPGNV